MAVPAKEQRSRTVVLMLAKEGSRGAKRAYCVVRRSTTQTLPCAARTS